MKNLNLREFIRAIRTQAVADMRPNFLGMGILGLILAPIGMLLLLKVSLQGQNADIVKPLTVSLVAAAAAFGIIQICSEIYTERLSGTLLRVRTLPHGPLSWSIGKSISTLLVTLASQVLILVGAYFLFPPANYTATQLALLIVVMVAAAIAHTPIGFILGALFRSPVANLLVYLFALALLGTSGVFFPITAVPRLLQYVHTVFPTYWSGHLARYLFMSADTSWEMGQSYHPLLACLILLGWIIVGYALTAFTVKRSFRKESIGALASIQGKVRAQVGL
ncbi:MAG: ABC transporter permease [Actinomycetaceae bacterium]|nr:ABC transporter permease [Actinomycetaceae bacterium]